MAEENSRMIRDVSLKMLETHPDERGFFREGFGQWSMSAMRQDVVKARHIHRVQVDWWYVARGVRLIARIRPRRPRKGSIPGVSRNFSSRSIRSTRPSMA